MEKRGWKRRRSKSYNPDHTHKLKILSPQFFIPSVRDVKLDAHHERVIETEEIAKQEF